MSKKYRVTRSEQVYQGRVYGLAITGNAQGILYNKLVFAAAGITAPPRTPDEFVAALRAVKAKTTAIPLYTNYSAVWPLSQREFHRVVKRRSRGSSRPDDHTSWPIGPSGGRAPSA